MQAVVMVRRGVVIAYVPTGNVVMGWVELDVLLEEEVEEWWWCITFRPTTRPMAARAIRMMKTRRTPAQTRQDQWWKSRLRGGAVLRVLLRRSENFSPRGP